MRNVIQELLDSSISTSAILQGAPCTMNYWFWPQKKKNKHEQNGSSNSKKLYEFATADSSDLNHCFYF